jgi:L-alanine-DL-glutamate epimerase-like enolase superfamily enzyme
MAVRADMPVRIRSVRTFKVPTDRPESDGTLEWDSTTMILVAVEGGGETGIGYTYASAATACFISEKLVDAVAGCDALATPSAHRAMVRSARNEGRPGVASAAISAVDNALWDLKGSILGVSVAALLGQARDTVPVYGSGGFTSYDDGTLAEQLGGWADEGLAMVKMKVGREPGRDGDRVDVARRAIGAGCGLFVDANGAHAPKEALRMAQIFAGSGVSWFEEPVSSDDLAGLRLVRDRAPAGMAISAGEYGYDLPYFQRMLAAGAVDVLQADATRCGGITGFMGAAAVAEASGVPLSAHCAPALHVHPCAAATSAIHAEWFHDHVRLEHMLFDGAPHPISGSIAPSDRAGLGLTLKESEATRFET